MTTCYCDQRKLGQVIDQMRILANNMDELRAEINVLRNSYSKSKENHSCASVFKRNSSSETNVLSKLKKYMRKVTSIYSLRKGHKDQETYYPCTNMDPRLPSFLSYIFRTRKKENLSEIPTRIKYLKSRGIQTNGKLESRRCIAKSPAIIPTGNVDDVNDDGFLFAKHEHERYNKIIFPKKYATLASHCSEISCELDFQIENPMTSPSGFNVNIFSDSCSFKNCPENARIVLSDSNDEQLATKYTQTKVGKLRRKSEHLNFHHKQSNLCFSKMRNAVITKKIIRNSNERTFTVCGEVNDVRDYPRLRKICCKQCSCGKRRNFTQWNDQKGEENFPMEKTVQKKSDDLPINDNMFENIPPATKSDLSSSLVSLDINISNSSSNVEDFPERRKPRTYVIRRTTQKCNQNNCSSNFERSVICLGQTSDLTLSSYSFPNHNIHFN
ncbi:hypothetical protein QLX08_003860 [Tetragonisca angustula]|uniref:Uncharacterized protein n=1 Tax=Tetragonisca angustula TaxID=166442 RepID=A0AAW1A4R7_9HYME